jgi:MFS family permease
MDAAALRRARIGTVGFFALNGVVGFSFLPRLVEIQADVGLDDAGLGIVLAIGTAGGLVVGPIAGVLVQRWGSVRVSLIFGLLMLPGLVAVGFAGSAALLAVALAVLLGADAIMDSAMNSRALEVQEAYGRSIINSLHAWWSLATIVGSGLGALSAVLEIPLGTFLTGVAVVAAVALLLSARQPHLDVPSIRPIADPPANRRRALGLMLRGGGILLGVYIMLAVTVEDVPIRWGSIYLDSIGGTAVLITVAYVTLTSAMTLGRFVGDRLVDRFGEVTVVRASMVAIAIARGAALIQGSSWAFIAACAVSGFGVATLFPAAMHAASSLPGVSAAMGVAVIAWLSRAGFVLAPLAVGLIAGANDVRAGLWVMVVAAIALVGVAGVLRISRPDTMSR